VSEEWAKNPTEYIGRLSRETNLPPHETNLPDPARLGGIETVARKHIIEHHLQHIERHAARLRELLK
jgi:hypothetical protein